MASFYNQATLVFGGRRTNSNTTESAIVDVLSLSKNAISASYSQNGTITYTVTIVNSGTTAASGINLTDTLGAYDLSGTTLYPLNYVDGSISTLRTGNVEPLILEFNDSRRQFHDAVLTHSLRSCESTHVAEMPKDYISLGYLCFGFHRLSSYR